MNRILQLAPRVVMTLNVDVSEIRIRPVSMEHLFYLPKDTIFQLERICREHQVSEKRTYILKAMKRGGLPDIRNWLPWRRIYSEKGLRPGRKAGGSDGFQADITE